MVLPKDKQQTLDGIVPDLQNIEGVLAIVLGGSYAAGAANPGSDLDMGIYYSSEHPFRIEDIRMVAKRYSVTKNLTITNFYEWGPWVNGGAWIQTSCGKVDFLYRNLEQVAATIEKAKNGQWENDFGQQPPYGFSSMIYLGETQTCIPLYDPNKYIANLKKQIQIYPSKLKESVIQQSLWSAEFTIWHAEYFFSRTDDIYNTMGCLTRAVKNIVTALFAINEIYPLGDKRALDALNKANQRPEQLKEKIDAILVFNKKKIGENIDLLKKLFKETAELANGYYKAFPYPLIKV